MGSGDENGSAGNKKKATMRMAAGRAGKEISEVFFVGVGGDSSGGATASVRGAILIGMDPIVFLNALRKYQFQFLQPRVLRTKRFKKLLPTFRSDCFS